MIIQIWDWSRFKGQNGIDHIEEDFDEDFDEDLDDSHNDGNTPNGKSILYTITSLNFFFSNKYCGVDVWRGC